MPAPEPTPAYGAAETPWLEYFLLKPVSTDWMSSCAPVDPPTLSVPAAATLGASDAPATTPAAQRMPMRFFMSCLRTPVSLSVNRRRQSSPPPAPPPPGVSPFAAAV